MGKLRMIDQGIGFKNKDTNAALTLPASEVKKVTWFKGVRGPTIRIVTGKGESMDFESLPRDVGSAYATCPAQI